MVLFIPDMAGHLFLVILLFVTFQYIKAQGPYPKPDITVNIEEDFIIICLIPGSFSPDSTCNLYVGEESQPSFIAKIMKRKATSASGHQFCQFTPKHSDLISRLQSVRRKEVSCDYRVSSGPNSLSPRSDGHSFTRLTVTSTLTPGITVTTTSVQLRQAAVGVASGVGVFLMGLTAVCLCWRTKKHSQRPTDRQDDHSQCDLVMGAMSSAGMLDSKDAGIYSLITSVPSTFLPSGPVEENGQSSEKDNSDTYHVYSSNPDRPATSAQPDGLYSLVQAH
ncbi:uncharacterized protein LOC109877386 isoform X2 [Oncorhynchus kisutch]|uniref:uncharacterized protein LOC109877386 isoform X2 n=1 Tax=Oncorhynchus kisutch TaxID=8019 RepID=UPI00099FE39F|nr:uncharacterized protein LOC109877386 isoform X2 [Oncorhynchus kisutch]